ncbi:MAG: RagB/SusD family nutrient uptake outer membrane protein [Sediminicola sp.]
MKYSTYFSGLLLICMVLFSCEDRLELDPITDKVAGTFFSNEAEIESGITAVYAQLQNNGLYGLDLIGVGEISGEDSFEEIPANDSGRFGQLDDFSTIPGNGLVGAIWSQSYIGIQRANTILNRIQEITYDNPDTKTARIGEMQFVRALLYFNLVRLYGDVPLVLVETENSVDFFGQGRTPANEVYGQIEMDLLDAIQNLSLAKSPGRPAKGAAQALLGDVYLTQGNFLSALPLFEAVVTSEVYDIAPTTAQIFGMANEGNPEILFEVQFASGLNGNDEGSSAGSQFRPSGTTANAKGHNLPTTAFVNSYEPNDTRRNDYVGRDDGNDFYFSLKYEVSSTGADDGGSDHIVIRYSDVVLKYAEALNENSRTEEAILQLDRIRLRANLNGTDASSQDEVRAAIRMERRFEFTGEGHRWFDLKRYGTAVPVMNAFFADAGINLTIDENHLLLPIPQSQLDTDPDFIKQNPGY